MKKLFIFLMMTLTLTNCASYNPGNQAVLSSASQSQIPLQVTGHVLKDYSTEHFLLLDFTFSNNTEEWIRVTDIELDFGDRELSQKGHLVVGSDLTTWAKGISKKVEIDQYNSRIFLSALTLTGAGMSALAKNNEEIALAGGIVALSSTSVLVVNDIYKKLTELQKSEIFPQDHLYRAFSVPPGLFTKKWVVLNFKKNDRPDKIFFTLRNLRGETERYQLKI